MNIPCTLDRGYALTGLPEGHVEGLERERGHCVMGRLIQWRKTFALAIHSLPDSACRSSRGVLAQGGYGSSRSGVR